MSRASDKGGNMNKPMMTCGHSANGKKAENKDPVCVICNCDEVAPSQDFSMRMAKCIYGCGSQANSSVNLPFFEHKPKEEFDIFYSGCRGW